jgi:hypothetical protein
MQSVILMRAKNKKREDKLDSRNFVMMYCDHCEIEAAYPQEAIRCTICKTNMKIISR